MATRIGCLPTQALAFLAVFVYATHATQAIAFEWKPGFRLCIASCMYNAVPQSARLLGSSTASVNESFFTSCKHIGIRPNSLSVQLDGLTIDVSHTMWRNLIALSVNCVGITVVWQRRVSYARVVYTSVTQKIFWNLWLKLMHSGEILTLLWAQLRCTIIGLLAVHIYC